MRVRCYGHPAECGYYRGGHCAMLDETCTDMLADERKAELGLKIKCYLDPDACKHFRGGTCQRFCCDCAAVHVDEIVEDGGE